MDGPLRRSVLLEVELPIGFFPPVTLGGPLNGFDTLVEVGAGSWTRL